MYSLTAAGFGSRLCKYVSAASGISRLRSKLPILCVLIAAAPPKTLGYSHTPYTLINPPMLEPIKNVLSRRGSVA
jgi:hypothetical protein